MDAHPDNGHDQKTPTEKPGARFMRNVLDSAARLLDEWVGPERAAEAKGRVAAAFQASAMSAKNPQEFYDCTPGSVANCVAISALTGIMPSTGALALAYVRPQRARRDDPPNLMYSLSHRGIVALAKRAGMTLIPLACGKNDKLVMADGEVATFEPDIDDPPLTWDELRGVVIVVKDASTGRTLFRGWVARKIIEARREVSQAYQFALKNKWAQATDPWHAWPVEQAMKTGCHYSASRGWVVIDDTEAIRALAADSRSDTIDVESEVVLSRPATDGPLGDLGLKPRAIEERNEPHDLDDLDEQVRLDQSDEGKIKVNPTPTTEPAKAAAPPKAPKPKAEKPPPTQEQPKPPTSDEAQLAADIAKGRARRAVLDRVAAGVSQLGAATSEAVAKEIGLDPQAVVGPLGMGGLSDEDAERYAKALSAQVDRELDGIDGGRLGE